jgi:glycosyltransferase involved in cell wall biosynthesis
MCKKSIVLVEPICRGSRLHWLWLVAKSLQDKYVIILLVREDYQSKHFSELMDGLDYELVAVPGDFGGEWLPRISAMQWWAYLKKLREFDRAQDDSYQVVFMALDDYLESFFLCGWSRFLFRNVSKVWTVKYRVDCLRVPLKNMRQWIIGRVMHQACRIWKINTIVLDERLKKLKIGGQTVNWLPDPWFGEFSPNLQDVARAKSPFAVNDFVALLIGRQDIRKGFSFMLDAIPPALESIPNLKIYVCGKIDEDHLAGFKQIIDRFGSERIHHDPEYISEEDLPLAYATASVVLMPYAPFFTSTSGVLPRAAASGVPVLASEHGLVGDRVRRYPLGMTFKYGDLDGFLTALRAVSRNGYAEQVQVGCAAFARSCSEKAFMEAVQDLI